MPWRNALRDAELPPPGGGMGASATRVGRCGSGAVAPEAKPRGSVWRIYWPRIAAAAAAVLSVSLRVNSCFGRTRRWRMMGLLSHRWRKTGQPRLPYRSPAEPETVRTPLQRRWDCLGCRPPGTYPPRGGGTLLAAAAGQSARKAALENVRADGEPAVPGRRGGGRFRTDSEGGGRRNSKGGFRRKGKDGLRRDRGGGLRRKGAATGCPAARDAVGGRFGQPYGTLRRAVRGLHQTA